MMSHMIHGFSRSLLVSSWWSHHPGKTLLILLDIFLVVQGHRGFKLVDQAEEGTLGPGDLLGVRVSKWPKRWPKRVGPRVVVGWWPNEGLFPAVCGRPKQASTKACTQRLRGP